MRIWERTGELKKGRKEKEISHVEKKNRKEQDSLPGLAATPPCFSVYTSEYTSAPAHSQLVASFFFFANPCMTIKSNCTSAIFLYNVSIPDEH